MKYLHINTENYQNTLCLLQYFVIMRLQTYVYEQ